MTLTRRLSLFFTALAVVTAAVIGGLAYYATSHSLDAEIRTTLNDAVHSLLRGQVPDGLPLDADDLPGGTRTDDDDSTHVTPSAGSPTPTSLPERGEVPPRRGSQLLAQQLDATGAVAGVDGGSPRLPVGADEVRAAGSQADHVQVYRTVTIDGEPYLMLTQSRGRGGGAVQVARALHERDEVLGRLAVSILLIALAVAAAAALAGTFLARRLTRGLVRLTAVAEEVTATGRLDVEVPTHGRDEVGRLGAAFNTMLGRLARSREDQQRLVQDAGHELRTPLTSIRTNISLLRRVTELPAAEREGVLDDLASESRELTGLVNELVELATEQHNGEEDGEVDLPELLERVAVRARRRSGREILPEIAGDAPTVVLGRSGGLERAVSNLVDNALKFDRGGSEPVEIGLSRTSGGGVRLEVRDRGPGIPPEDLGQIFDRFHRATAVRSQPGSGLGLSIVEDVATTHGGRVFAANRPGGGAVIGFTLPAARLQTGSNPR